MDTRNFSENSKIVQNERNQNQNAPAVPQKDQYLITKNPLLALFIFFLPVALGNVFQQFYNLVDSSILGRFVSEQALAAAAACLSFTNIFLFVGNGYGIGAGVVVGKYFGAGDYKNMKVVISTTFITSFAMSLVLGALGIAIARPVMVALQTPPDTIDMACLYLRIYFGGMPFVILYNVTAAMFNALGKSKYPLFFLIISSLMNIGLDLLFVKTFESGIAGVAYATLISQAFACLLSMAIFFLKLKKLKIGKTAFFSKMELLKITKIGLPSIFQQATISIGLMLIQSTINSFGSAALAGYSVGARIESLGSAVVIACGASLSTFVAQNLGAKKYKRIHQGYLAANLIVAIFCVLFFIFVLFFKNKLIYLMLGNDCSQTAFDTAKQILVFMSEVMCMLGFKHTADGVVRGLGRMSMFTLGNLINIVIRVSFSKLMAPVIGMQAVWISNPIGWTASLVLCYLSYRRAKKQLGF